MSRYYGLLSCNETGKWQAYEEAIDKACMTSDWTFVYDTYVHKNVFCYACNQNLETVSLACFNQGSKSPFTGDAFSVLLSYEDVRVLATDKMNRTPRCDTDEIEDVFLNKCRVLYCPIGSVAYDGVCEQTALQIDNLWIDVLFQLTFVWDRPELKTENTMMYNFESLGSDIYGKFHEILGFREAKCRDWFYSLWIGRKSKPADVGFIFWASVKISSEACSLVFIYARSAAVTGQTVNIETNETTFKLTVSVEKRHIDVMKSESDRLIFEEFHPTIPGSVWPFLPKLFRLYDERICPLIEIEYEDSFFVPTRLAEGFRSFFVGSEMFENTTTVRVCFDDYFAVMAPNHASGHGTICCSLLLTMLVYIPV